MSFSLGLSLYKKWKRLKTYTFSLMCKGAFYKLGNSSRIQMPAHLNGEKWISIGERVYIGENSWIQAYVGQTKSDSPKIHIGDGTGITGYCTITAINSVIIEQNVLIARNVYIADHSHEYNKRGEPIILQGVKNVAPVRICEGAWLGQGVVVCPGVTIGRGAVVGANAVVLNDIPDYCVAAGIPAKILHYI